MKIAIIDNEAELRSGLKAMIKKYCSDNAILLEADGVESGVKIIEEVRPNLVFLDIEMEDGTGFDLLKRIHQPEFQLIFTTAHNKYAIQAFKFSAIDYLLKPIDKDELQKSFKRAVDNIDKSDLGKQLSILQQQLSNKPSTDRKIVLNDKQSTYFLKLDDILFCEAEGPYTKFYLNNHSPILVSKNLKEYEELLAPLGFIRTHHSYIVNPDKIIKYDKTNGGSFLVEGNHIVHVSQRRKDIVMQAIEKNK